jgi:hypothetical protein
MTNYQRQFDSCCGPSPKPYLKPRLISGINKELKALRDKKLEDIETEYEQEFGNT